MKNIKQFRILLTYLKFGFVLIIMISCGSHEQNPDLGFERFKESKMMINDSVNINQALISESMKTEPLKKTENINEWMMFKIEVEKKIIANENKIKEIKRTPNISSNLLKTLSNIEKENLELRKQMDDFNEEAKVKFEKFKTLINHDINVISIELKNISLIK